MAGKLPDSIQLEIVTPDRQFFAGTVDSVTVPGVDGYLGILPGHAPLLSELKSGVTSYRSPEGEFRIFSSRGFVEVLPGQVSVLVEKTEAADQIDRDAAQAAKRSAEEAFRSHSESTSHEEVMEQWEEAVARLEVAGSK